MQLYRDVSYQISRMLTLRYSTSFGLSSKLLPSVTRQHIYAIYGLVRIADEVVDSYGGDDAAALLTTLEAETYDAIHRGYSTNPIIQSFADTARQFNIDQTLITPFFNSMHMDLSPTTYTDELYATYIDGSAEVIGLMCLRVFCADNNSLYEHLESGARALGSAYQKVNFLRDIAADHAELGRSYFPGIDYVAMNDDDKRSIIADISADFTLARPAIEQLPTNCRRAVRLSYHYYQLLLDRLNAAPIEQIKSHRLRVSNGRKLTLLAMSLLPQRRTNS